MIFAMTLRLASFNVENLGEEGGDAPALAARIEALRPVLTTISADILCLQEVSAKRSGPGHHRPRSLAALDAVLTDTPYRSFHRVATVNPETGHLRDIHNLVILSRLPVLGSQQVQHELVPPPAWRRLTGQPEAAMPEPVIWERPLLHARLALADGRTLHVINLHLRAPLPAMVPGAKDGPWRWRDTRAFAEGCFLAELKRAGQAFEARLLIDQIFDAEPEALLIVAGDFNAGAGEMPVKTIAATSEETGNAELDGRGLRTLSATVPQPRRFTVLHGGEPLMLDHLLASRNLANSFRCAEILNERIGDELFDWLWRRQTAGSHHAPVIAEFDLPA